MRLSIRLPRRWALSSSVSLALMAAAAGTGSALAQDAHVTIELKSSILSVGSPQAEITAQAAIPLPPDLPALDAAPAIMAEFAPAPDIDIPPPDLPPVEVVIDLPSSAPAAAAAVILPEPPDAPATLLVETLAPTMLDRVAGVLEQRLAAEAATPAPLSRIGRKDRALIAHYYESRGFKPLLVDSEGVSAPGHAVMRQVATAELDGLDPAAYPVPGTLAAPLSPEGLADAELTLAAAAFDYARDARGGRIEPSRLSALITPDLVLPTPAEVLGAIATASDAGEVLAGYQPQHDGYRALREKLAEMRDSTGAVPEKATIAEGRQLRPGMSDPRVPSLRARLGVPAEPDDVFDDQLSQALATWQKQQGLRPTGRLERGMAAALNGKVSSGSVPIADVIANMERWRWLPQDLGERHIEVNLPEYTLRVVDNGHVVHTARVVIGKPDTPTPIFSNRMQMVVVNPYWHIPPSIMKNEILPRLAENPNYAAEHGYEVVRRGNSISVRQPPGERNALGFIKFLFPNQHAVYLHDTPSRALFARNERAFSHGCVRVDQPFRLGEVVLGAEGFDEQRLRKMVGTGERTIRLKQELPIHLTYFTLFVDENGRLQRREDIYGHDGKVRTALGIARDGRSYAQLR